MEKESHITYLFYHDGLYDLSPRFFRTDAVLLCEFESDKT